MLITSVFIIGFSIIASTLESARQQSDDFIVSYTRVNESKLKQLQNWDEVSNLVYTPVLKEVAVVVDYDPNGNESYMDAQIINVLPDIELKEGRLPENENEVVVHEYMIYNAQSNEKLMTKENNLKVEKQFEIVGIFNNQSSHLGFIWNALMTKSDAQPEYYLVSVAFDNPSQKNYNQLVSTVGLTNINLTYYGRTLGFQDQYGQMGDPGNTVIMILGGSIISIILLSGYFVISNAFNMASTQQIYTFGQLFSVGATIKQQGLIVLFESLMVGLVGILGGILLGILGSSLLVQIILGKLPFITDTFKVSYPLWGLPIIFVLGILVVLFSAVRPIERVEESSMIEILRFNRVVKLKKAPRWVKKQDFVTQFAHKNYSVSKKQFNKVLIGITLSITLYITVTSLTNFLYKDIQMSEPTINISGGMSTQFEEFVNGMPAEIKFKDDHFEYNYYSNREVSSPSKSFNAQDYFRYNIQSFDDETYRELFNSELPVILNYTYEYQNNKMVQVPGPIDEPNNRIMLSFRDYKNNKSDAMMVQVIDEKPETNIYLPYMTLIMPKSVADELDYLDISYQNYVGKIEDYHPSMDPILAEYQAESDNEFYISNGYENNRTTTNILFILDLIVNVFVILITLISLSNIFNTLTTQFVFRAKEFSLLEAVGATEKQLRKMVMVESIITILRAVVWGFVISTGFFLLINLVSFTYGNTTRIYPIWTSYAIVIIVLIVSVVSISLYSLGLLKKQNLMDKLKQQF